MPERLVAVVELPPEDVPLPERVAPADAPMVGKYAARASPTSARACR